MAAAMPKSFESHPSEQVLEVSPGPEERTVKTAEGRVLCVPPQWSLLPPGDAALSRRVKKEGGAWVVKEKKGRKMFSLGIWAPSDRIARLQAELASERKDPSYEKKLEAGRRRRAKEQESYAAEFEASVLAFLRFDDRHRELSIKMAKAISEHAVPVGSGTVARTKRISVERRAEAATIAWMRHQTTAYDTMRIPREKGMRREVRRMLAEHSRRLLNRYRDPYGGSDPACPLKQALSLDSKP